MLKLIDWVRRDIATDIESRTSRLPYHADSTVGMISESKTATSEKGPLLSTLSLDNMSFDG